MIFAPFFERRQGSSKVAQCRRILSHAFQKFPPTRGAMNPYLTQFWGDGPSEIRCSRTRRRGGQRQQRRLKIDARADRLEFSELSECLGGQRGNLPTGVLYPERPQLLNSRNHAIVPPPGRPTSPGAENSRLLIDVTRCPAGRLANSIHAECCAKSDIRWTSYDVERLAHFSGSTDCGRTAAAALPRHWQWLPSNSMS